MKVNAIVPTLLLSGMAAAQDVQSKPFELVISSADKSINGKKFAACHTGAAIESFCLSGNSGTSFYFNTTQGVTAPLKGYTAPGALVYNLPVGGDKPTTESEAMYFYVDPTTNVALPLLEPSYDRTEVAFDKSNALVIIDYLDDTTTPPTDETPKALKNWYLCQTNYAGYQYKTLAWALGNAKAKPQNPSCVKIDVIRKFTK